MLREKERKTLSVQLVWTKIEFKVFRYEEAPRLKKTRSGMQEPHLSSGGAIARGGSRKRFLNGGEAGVHRRPRGAMPPAIANRSGEVSNSNSARHQSIKHAIHNNEVRNFKYKGLVIQPNGHWGVQIYANQQRVWLGTFKSETEAAMAYNRAAIKLRGPKMHRNFPWTEISLQEMKFQSQFSTSSVLNMIKDGSYNCQFSDYLKAQTPKRLNISVVQGNNSVRMWQLFQKELTPSDVSKLNRLVIPKKYAVHFPPIPESGKENDGTVADVELVFFDREMTSWTFRYCYWKSSQSFVFTRGWAKFTKKKGLKPKDRVIFSAYDNGNGLGDARRMCFIDVEYDERAPGGGTVAVNNNADEVGQRHAIDQPCPGGNGNGVRIMDVQHDGGGEDMEGNEGNVPNGEKKSVLLFGVRIA